MPDIFDWYDAGAPADYNWETNPDSDVPPAVFNPRTDSDEATRDLGLTPEDVSSYSSNPAWKEILKALGLTPTQAGLLAGGVGLSALLGGPTPDTGYKGGIPYLTANRTMLPIPPSTTGYVAPPPVTDAAGAVVPPVAPRRPGSGGVTYFSPMTYTRGTSNPGIMPPVIAPTPVPTPAAPPAGGFPENGFAQGGIASLAKGRLLDGPGDGVSDSIPASIDGHQPAALADGEYVIPARIVSELGNGSTKAGAQRLDAMMKRIQTARRKATDIAANTRADKHLPA